MAAAAAVAAADASAKRKKSVVGTHSGTFHCDEALGCYLLRQTPAFRDSEIVRSRDPAVLAGADVVLDVGGAYEPDALRFDHHQRGFVEVFGHGYATKLSSAGLVYKHYGRAIVAQRMALPEDHPDVTAVWLEIYKTFIEAVDGNDNGVNQYESDKPPRYVVNTTLPARVAALNPNWSDPYTDDSLYQGFLKAVELTGKEFEDALAYVSKYWLPAKSLVAEAVKGRKEVDPSGRIIKLSQGGVPWKQHLYALEGELGLGPDECVLFVLYEDEREKKWRIQAVSAAPGSFENRKSIGLPAWRGLRDDELSAACGVPGCVFIHASGFIGGNATYEGALQMARLSLAAPDE
ncbi:metal-dependent hydrolase [Raphidocelis subcapitata]|uniref:Metal-dependent hydrolase n=1 Tax=Raphidocelis subcapitata TaxID=307507 RepID=A0A2V0NNL5_9CHLO|nr:metal-dependent hydrolase [Raphidocelis subcapitata]|eukprot:GBF89168.1 metal-dependent hydrolase [Raphidocelis subcapitata]